MRISAFVGVKDEVELIGGAVENLRKLAVDGIAVADMGSTDGTLDVLSAFEGDSDFLLLRYHDLDPAYSSAEAPQFQQFLSHFNPDWVMLSDADERWITACPSITAVAGLAESSVMIVSRFNVPLSAKGLASSASLGVDENQNFELVVSGPPDIEQTRTLHPRHPASLLEMWPRVMFRPEIVQRFQPGFHGIIPLPGAEGRIGIARDMFVAHLPYTTRARFARKMANVRSYVLRAEPLKEKGDAGHGWRRLADIEGEDAQSQEYQNQLMSPEDLAVLRAEKRLLSVADIFASGQCGDGILAAFVQAQHLEHFGQREEAIEALRAVIRRDRSLAQAHWTLVDVLAKEDRLDEAEAALSYAMELAESNVLSVDSVKFLAWSHAWLGEILMRQGELERAEPLIRRAVDLHPLAPWARLHSEVSTRLDQLDAAITAVRHAISLAPDNAEYHAHLVHLLLRCGRLPEARDAFQLASPLGITWTHDADLHLLVDGQRVDPDRIDGRDVVFALSGSAAQIAIVSRYGIPALTDDGSDLRRLGVALNSITVEHGGGVMDIPLEDPRLSDGFYQYADGHRWTAEHALLPAEMTAGLDGALRMRLTVVGSVRYCRLAPQEALRATDPDLHLLADGMRIDPLCRSRGVYRFRLGKILDDIVLVSRSVVPYEAGLGSDRRRLGVALTRLVLIEHRGARDIALDDPVLGKGFYEHADTHRWTDGAAQLSAAACRDATDILITIHLPTLDYALEAGRAAPA